VLVEFCYFSSILRKGVIGAGCVAYIPANSRVFYGRIMLTVPVQGEIVDFDAPIFVISLWKKCARRRRLDLFSLSLRN
jgi:hypothetical protein